MSPRIILSIILLLAFFFPASLTAISNEIESPDLEVEADLNLVNIYSHADAEALIASGADVLLPVSEGYLVLAGQTVSDRLAKSGLKYRLVVSFIGRNQMAIDITHDTSRKSRFPLIYEEGGLRLYRIESTELKSLGPGAGLMPLPDKSPKVIYKEPQDVIKRLRTLDLELDLDSLIGCISQDSVESYSYALEEFGNRPVGSGTNKRCAQWIFNKFDEMGYDSVVYQSFIHENSWGIFKGRNVLAYKIGTLYPYDQIVIGAHLDGEIDSPAADDNGSGVVGVLEVARVLKDIDTKMTIIFAAWDAEEEGLCGSWEYVAAAAEREDRIIFNLNMDMIGFYRNDYDADLYFGPNTEFAELWAYLADSLAGINIAGHMVGISGNSDHASFIWFGYDAMELHEFIFSNVYHSPRDSTTYLDFEYMKRMIMGSLATTYYVDGTFIPAPALMLTCPEELPEVINPGGSDTLRIHVEEYAGAVLLPGSVTMFCSINNEPFAGMSMTDIGGGVYEAELPTISCGDIINYYVSAVDQTASQFHYFPGLGSSMSAIMTTAVIVPLDDDFESDLGWTVQSDATMGYWERWRAASNTAYPQSDYDWSGKCYLTDHGLFADVDNGVTSMLSPLFDVSNGMTRIEYARWFDNGDGWFGKEDIFRVYIHDGSQWVVVDTAGPVEEAAGEWTYKQFWLHDYCTPTGPIQLRFDASDMGNDSYIEAAVDAVKVTLYSYAPQIYTESLSDVLFGDPYNLQLDASGCYDPLVWTDKDSDLEGTGLTLSTDGLLSGMPSDTGEISFIAYLEDGEGVPAEQAYVFHVWLPFICGDATMDYQLNVGDAVYLINFVFKDGPTPYPLCVGDANDDDATNVGDAVYLINHIFKAGPPPVEGCCQL